MANNLHSNLDLSAHAAQGPDKCGEHVCAAAEALGKACAERGWTVLTGGRSRGVMDAACKGAKASTWDGCIMESQCQCGHTQ